MQMDGKFLNRIMAVMMLLMVSLSANTQTSNSILGQWKDADHPQKQVEITSHAGKFVGKSINSSKTSEIGKIVFKDLKWIDSSKSYKGILINPDNGDEFNIEIKMIGIDGFRFSAGKFIFSRTFTFNRITK
jgi:uncharacterized protein (DUF2147 family)